MWISKEGRCRPKVEHGACANAVVAGCWVQLDKGRMGGDHRVAVRLNFLVKSQRRTSAFPLPDMRSQGAEE